MRIVCCIFVLCRELRTVCEIRAVQGEWDCETFCGGDLRGFLRCVSVCTNCTEMSWVGNGLFGMDTEGMRTETETTTHNGEWAYAHTSKIVVKALLQRLGNYLDMRSLFQLKIPGLTKLAKLVCEKKNLWCSWGTNALLKMCFRRRSFTGLSA